MIGVCYTAIIGKYDHLKDPQVVTKGWDYVCFTDQPNIKSNIWNVIKVNDPTLDSTRLARKIKILGHPYIENYNKSLWVDGSVEIKTDLDQFINKYKMNGQDIMLAWHGGRKCLYDEARICMKIGKDDVKTIKKQILTYKLQRYPSNNGLVQTGIIVRTINERVKNFNEQWWDQVRRGSKRDQLSFNYIAWKNKDVLIYTITPQIFYSDFQLYNHTPNKQRLKQKKQRIKFRMRNRRLL